MQCESTVGRDSGVLEGSGCKASHFICGAPLPVIYVSRLVLSDFFDPMDSSPPGSSVLRIFQAGILEWEMMLVYSNLGFPGGISGKEPDCQSGDLGSIPGSGRSPSFQLLGLIG